MKKVGRFLRHSVQRNIVLAYNDRCLAMTTKVTEKLTFRRRTPSQHAFFTAYRFMLYRYTLISHTERAR